MELRTDWTRAAAARRASPYQTAIRVLEFTIALALPAWIFWRLSLPMLANAIGYDEQVFVWGGWSILKGRAPYRDFMEWKPPVSFITHALALKLFGFAGERFRLFFLFFSMGSIVALVASMMKRGGDRIVCAAFGIALVHMFLYPGLHETFVADTESIGLAYYFFGVAALIANTRFRTAAEILGGILLTCCTLSKEPFAFCVVATWASCYFLVHGRFSRISAKRYFLHTTIGVGIAIALLCVYMVPTGAMSAYITLVRRYATMFTDPQKGYCAVLGVFKPTGNFWTDLPLQGGRLHGDFFNVATLGFLTPFFVASLVFVPKRSIGLFVGSLVTLLAAIQGVCAANCFFPHYYVLGESGLMFFLAAGVCAVGPRLATAQQGVRLWIRALVLLAMMIPVLPRLEAAWEVKLEDGPPVPEPVAGVYDFMREHSSPGDKVFTTGPPALYLVVDRIPAIRGCTIIDELIPAMPGNTDAEKLRFLYDELVKGMPKVVFLDPEHGNRKHRHMAAAISPFLSDYGYTKVSDMLYVRP